MQSEFANAQPSQPPRPGRILACLKFAFISLFLFATCGPSVVAEDEGPAAFFRADRERLQRVQQAPQHVAKPVVVQRPTHLIRRGAPVRGFAREVPLTSTPVDPNTAQPSGEPGAQTADGRPAGDVAAPPAPQQEKPVAAKPVEPAFFALVIGDSLGQMLGVGLTEAFADNPEVSILRKARENTGLVRDDYFDWVKGARDLVAANDKINIAVMMIGSNDRQQLRDGTVGYDMRQPRWKQIYAERVEAIARIFKDKKIPLVWVGLPVMKNERFSADMATINEIYQESGGKAGATYVDTWEAFLDDRGQFAAYGPDVNGQFQKLRAGDGVHFTKPGARKLAHFIESEIRHAIEDASPRVEPLVAALPSAPASPAPATPQSPAGPGPIVALPAPAELPAVIIPVKPPAGPVALLTGPALSPGGALASHVARTGAASGAQALLDRAIGQGQPQDARPGRADDFSWPRN